MNETCRCGRPLLTRPGDMQATCPGCHALPSFCDCGTVNSADTADFAANESPTPFGSTGPLPDFPTGCLPGWLEDEVQALAEEYQVPLDLPAVTVLAVLSACAGGRAKVRVHGSWCEPVNLYTFVAMESGTRKSPLFEALVRPLITAEEDLVASNRAAIAEAAASQDIAHRRAEHARKRAATATGAEAANELAEALAQATAAESIVIPASPRVVADDVTPEALVSLMAEQGGRMAILSDEAGIFSIIAGRYSKEPNMDVFLKGFSGGEIRVDRKGRQPEYVKGAALTLGLCAQPAVIRDIAQIPGARGRGLLARVLFSLPREMRGYRKIGTDSVPDHITKTYEDTVCQLLLSIYGANPTILVLDPVAEAVFMDLLRAIEPELRSETGRLEGIADWASKFVGSTVRIAGLLHLAEHLQDGYARPITPQTADNAIRIGNYFLAHAQAAFSMMGVDQGVEDARSLLRWLERHKPPVFTRQEMFSGVSRSVFRKVADLDAPLRLLEEHGYILRLPAPERTGPGRPPSPSWRVHPSVAAESA